MNPQEAKKLENKISEILEKYIKKNDKVVAGISGGPDSIFLLHSLLKFQAKESFAIIVAHVNHQLRKKDSDLDEKFVKKLIKNLDNKKIIFISKKANIAYLSKKTKSGLEETGRKIRYEFFNELAKKYHASYVITAHHADDNIETILSNFIRGAALEGLCGMKEFEKNLLRPLLFIPKKQILAYLKFKKIPCRLDKSNLETKYKRNFLRHKIVPQLKKLNPNLIETTAKNSKNLKEINEFITNFAQNFIKKNSLNKSFTKFDARQFRKLQPAIQKIILLKIHEKHCTNSTNIESIDLEEVLKIINQNIGNKKKSLGLLIFSLKNNIISVDKKRA